MVFLLRVAVWLSVSTGSMSRGRKGETAGQVASHGESVLLDLGRKAHPRDFPCISLVTTATFSCKRIRKWTIRLASLHVRERRKGVRLGAGWTTQGDPGSVRPCIMSGVLSGKEHGNANTTFGRVLQSLVNENDLAWYGSDGNEPTCNVGDLDSIPELGRSCGGGHSHPRQYSCLENPHGQRSLGGSSPRGRKGWDTPEQQSTAQKRHQRKGFPGGSTGRPRLQGRRPRLDSRVRKVPWRRDRLPTPVFLGFPGGSDGKESACSVGGLGLISGLGRSPGGGNSYPLQCSGLENPMDRGAWWATLHWVTKGRDTTEQLSAATSLR